MLVNSIVFCSVRARYERIVFALQIQWFYTLTLRAKDVGLFPVLGTVCNVVTVYMHAGVYSVGLG